MPRTWLAKSGITAGPVFWYVGRYGQIAKNDINRNSIGRRL